MFINNNFCAKWTKGTIVKFPLRNIFKRRNVMKEEKKKKLLTGGSGKHAGS